MPRVLALLVAAFVCAACASSPPAPASASPSGGASIRPAGTGGDAVVRAALGMVGVPYRYGGASPRGFDCSGLVIWAYEEAGHPGLPHSAARLAELAQPVALEALVPGDLMFFQLAGKKTSHVGIYVGDRRFVHAPSSGGRVEIVDFDHVYWRRHIGHAGRMLPGAKLARH